MKKNVNSIGLNSNRQKKQELWGSGKGLEENNEKMALRKIALRKK